MYCLWFGKQKIYNLDQLRKNFDFDTAEIYYLGGGLPRWLRQCGENEIAANVEKMDPLGDISKQLSEIFSVDLPKGRSNVPSKALPKENRANGFENNTKSFAYYANDSFKSKNAGLNYFNTKISSFKLFSDSFNVETGSFSSNNVSFELSSFYAFLSSFFIGSFETAAFQNLSGLGSFGLLSGFFTSGSYNLHEYEFEYGTSFKTTSFNLNEFNSGSFSNAIETTKDSGFVSENEKCAYRPNLIQLSPEEKIKLNIMFCPLNRFGYGIDLI